jgi:glycoside/pentoside/hexuronide:cation symporter, GPH family
VNGPATGRPISRLECFAFLVAMIGVQLSSELYAQWGTYFYSPPPDTGRTVYVAIGLVAIIFVAGRAFDIYTDSLIGTWSDRATPIPGRFRLLPLHGRRRPFIFWGSILMTLSGIAFWYPPVDTTSNLNLVYGTLLMSLHWGLYTLAYIPLLALSLDLARDEASRIRLGTWIAVGMILGIVIAALLPGALIVQFDTARETLAGEDSQFSAIGYQRVAILFAIISLLCFQFLVFVVNERDDEKQETHQNSVLRELVGALRLPRFRRYLLIFFFFYIGILANQRAFPYWVELGLGGDESTVTDLGIPFIIVCLLGALACPWLIKRVPLKWLMVAAVATMGIGLPFMYPVAALDLPTTLKFKVAAGLYALSGLGLGMMYVLVTPLMGELIDEYAEQFGERKEGLFNAMHAMLVKFAQVFAILIATQTMGMFGNSADDPTGTFLVAPIGGVFCIAALALALGYPASRRT